VKVSHEQVAESLFLVAHISLMVDYEHNRRTYAEDNNPAM
jgi:hypothetical protein